MDFNNVRTTNAVLQCMIDSVLQILRGTALRWRVSDITESKAVNLLETTTQEAVNKEKTLFYQVVERERESCAEQSAEKPKMRWYT